MRRWTFACLAVVMLLTLVAVERARSQTPQTPVGMTRTTLFENARVRVVKIKVDPGAREQVHKHDYDIVVTQLTPGQVEMVVADQKSTAFREAGYTWFVPKGMMHAGANVGKEPFEIVTVILK
jgi:oxalate decarboxylase/phosphoglucose isomerase-like protein (cupin superfamily)